MTYSDTNAKHELALLLNSTRAGAKTKPRKLDDARWWVNLYSGISDIKDIYYYDFWHIVETSVYVLHQ